MLVKSLKLRTLNHSEWSEMVATFGSKGSG